MNMNKKTFYILTIIVSAVIVLTYHPFALSKVELKESGAKLCLSCHPDLKQRLELSYVHKPVKEGKCNECHSPHTAKYPKLLSLKVGELCYKCHEDEKKKLAYENVHSPVKNGECIKCHDPHASNNKFQLIKEGGDLCFTCHTKLKEEAGETKHVPFLRGQCLRCHDPHASNKKYQLVKDVKELCIGCHMINKESVKTAHKNADMSNVDCTICHSPHGTNSTSLKMVKKFAHSPFASKECDSCHKDLKKNPKELILEGSSLCFSCHDDKKSAFESGKLHHPPVVEGKCIACHSPHASEYKSLLKGGERDICFSCHSAIKDKFKTSKYHHPDKAGDGKCTICHTPHTSNEKHLFAKEPLAVCSTCHATQGKFTHPVGAGVIDPRDKKSNVTCISCHNPHGTDIKYFLILRKDRELCVQCHKGDTH